MGIGNSRSIGCCPMMTRGRRASSSGGVFHETAEWPSCQGRTMQDSITVLIHGTYSSSNLWYKPGSRFHRYLRSHGFADVYSGSDYFRWRAFATPAARRRGAEKLIAWCREHPARQYRFIGHSHGANVANRVTQRRLRGICTLIHLAPPALPGNLPNLNYVTSGQFFTIHAQRDAIVTGLAGARQNYQSFPELAAHETVIELAGIGGHWQPVRVPNWQHWDIARIVSSVCSEASQRSVASRGSRRGQQGARRRRRS